MIDRLFVPMNKQPHDWVRNGLKRWELRLYRRQFTEQHVRVGRVVELRRGYSRTGCSVWGRIVAVQVAESIGEFYDAVPWQGVIPWANDQFDAIEKTTEILGDSLVFQRVIGFRFDRLVYCPVPAVASGSK